MSSDDFNRGYFFYDTSTQAGRDGDAARVRDQQAQTQQSGWSSPYQPPGFDNTGGYTSTSINRPRRSTSPAEPLTLVESIMRLGVLGLIIAVAYAWLGLELRAWLDLGVWAVKGAVAGAVAGAALFALFKVIEIGLMILAVAIKIAFWTALTTGGVYLLIQNLN
jgi:hypothetical protein